MFKHVSSNTFFNFGYLHILYATFATFCKPHLAFGMNFTMSVILAHWIVIFMTIFMYSSTLASLVK